MIKTSPLPTVFLQEATKLFGPRMQGVASVPWQIEDLEKRPLNLTKDRKKGRVAFYVTPRALDARLNLLFGAFWDVYFKIEKMGNTFVALATLKINEIVREDVAQQAVAYDSGKEDENAVTRAQASAYKRAAVKFGIGAYLYRFTKERQVWLPVNDYKQFENPEVELSDLPAWARPVAPQQLLLQELQHLCGTEETTELSETLEKYWGLKSIKTLDDDSAFALSMCVARISDWMAHTGVPLETVVKRYTDNSKSESQTGFTSGLKRDGKNGS